jgi:outer membrane lipoprotein-sorting protein
LKDGQQFPMLVTIRRPLDEYTLKIEVTKLSLNEKLEDDQFELKIPPGITIQKME